MKVFKLILAYDGTDFYGWQRQPTAITITSCLENTFLKVFNTKIAIVGASRTDTNVHALGQVATFHADINIPLATLQTAWNNMLPKSIHIRSLEQVPEIFHPQKNVRQKTYYYHLFLTRPLPIIARYGWHYEFIHMVDIQKFTQALACYQGEHDFKSFCKVEDEKTTVRTIDAISLEKIARFNTLRITIKGKSFLRFQIRRMIGYALDVARRPDLPVSYIQDMLEKPNAQQTLTKADGCGLCLRKVSYNNEFFIE